MIARAGKVAKHVHVIFNAANDERPTFDPFENSAQETVGLLAEGAIAKIRLSIFGGKNNMYDDLRR